MQKLAARSPQRVSRLNHDAVLQRGMALQHAKHFKEAEYCYQSVLRLNPANALASSLMGTLCIEAKRVDLAIEYFSKAAKHDPRNAIFHNNLGNAKLAAGRFEDAIRSLEKALKLAPEFHEALCNMGKAYRKLGKAELGLPYYIRAVKVAPGRGAAKAGLADSLIALGRIAEAEALLRELVKDHGHRAEALAGLAGIRRHKEGDPEIAEIEKLLADMHGLDSFDRIQLHHAAGKIYMDLYRPEEAFSHFARAKALTTPRFNLSEYRQCIDTLIGLFTPEFFASRRHLGHASQKPIFILGMPRSGTTLTEQIVSSHPDVFGAGELAAMTAIASSLGFADGPMPTYCEQIKNLERKSTLALAERYLSDLAWRAGEVPYVTDKMPHNFEHLGLIALLFPHARIVHCARNPLDNCVSCFTNRFSESHGYNTDLATLGLYYREYHRLMAHWRRVLPLEIFELRYEELIADTEAVSRRLLNFLGPEWHQGCLDFQKNERSVTTISRWQVRQPIYSTSVGKWKEFEPWLGPLIASLGELARYPSPLAGEGGEMHLHRDG
jgi:tetratricopeptide (TPR) repeat protein